MKLQFIEENKILPDTHGSILHYQLHVSTIKKTNYTLFLQLKDELRSAFETSQTGIESISTAVMTTLILNKSWTLLTPKVSKVSSLFILDLLNNCIFIHLIR